MTPTNNAKLSLKVIGKMTAESEEQHSSTSNSILFDTLPPPRRSFSPLLLQSPPSSASVFLGISNGAHNPLLEALQQRFAIYNACMTAALSLSQPPPSSPLVADLDLRHSNCGTYAPSLPSSAGAKSKCAEQQRQDVPQKRDGEQEFKQQSSPIKNQGVNNEDGVAVAAPFKLCRIGSARDASAGAQDQRRVSASFHAVLYDGCETLEPGILLRLPYEFKTLCHRTIDSTKANIGTEDGKFSLSTRHSDDCIVLRKICRGEEMVLLVGEQAPSVSHSGASLKSNNNRQQQYLTSSKASASATKKRKSVWESWKETLTSSISTSANNGNIRRRRSPQEAASSSAEYSQQQQPSANGGFQCSQCGKMFSYAYYRDKHLKYTRCVDNGDRKFPCPLCTRSFEKRDRLRIHVLHVHENHRPHMCVVCGKAFSQSSSLNKHLRVHSGERPYNCPYCTKAFTASSILRTHIRQHSGEKPFRCVFCGKSFASHAAHDSHVRRTHAPLPVNDDTADSIPTNTNQRAQAVIENESTTNSSVKPAVNRSSPTPSTCHFCGKSFEHQTHLRFHMHCVHSEDNNYA